MLQSGWKEKRHRETPRIAVPHDSLSGKAEPDSRRRAVHKRNAFLQSSELKYSPDLVLRSSIRSPLSVTFLMLSLITPVASLTAICARLTLSFPLVPPAGSAPIRPLLPALGTYGSYLSEEDEDYWTTEDVDGQKRHAGRRFHSLSLTELKK